MKGVERFERTKQLKYFIVFCFGGAAAVCVGYFDMKFVLHSYLTDADKKETKLRGHGGNNSDSDSDSDSSSNGGRVDFFQFPTAVNDTAATTTIELRHQKKNDNNRDFNAVNTTTTNNNNTNVVYPSDAAHHGKNVNGNGNDNDLYERHPNVLPSHQVQYLPLHCEERFQFYWDDNHEFTCDNVGKVPPNTNCSGLVMNNGNCIVHSNGTFLFYDEHQEDEEEQKLPLCDYFNPDVPTWNMSQFGILTSPNCTWKSMDPLSLMDYENDNNVVVKKQKKNDEDNDNKMKSRKQTRILVIGASHSRNLFFGFVAAIRNLRNTFDIHPTPKEKSEGVLYRYQVFSSKIKGKGGRFFRDQFNMYVGQDSINATLAQDDMEEQGGGSDTDEESIVIYFCWATNFHEQTRAFEHLIPRIQPQILVNAIINSYERQIAMDAKWKSTLLEAIQNHPPIFYAWIHWPWGHTVKGRITNVTESLFPDLESHGTQSRFLSIKTFQYYASDHGLVGSKQFASTFHSACPAWRDHISAKENYCPDPMDKAYSSVIMTLYHSIIHNKGRY